MTLDYNKQMNYRSLEQDRFDFSRLTRREFLQLAGTSILAACTPAKAPEPAPQIQTRDGYADLVKAISLLSDSPKLPIKRLLEGSVLRWYKKPAPASITISGIPIKLLSSSVEINYIPRLSEASGTFTPRGSQRVNQFERLTIVEDTRVGVPLIGIVRAEERANYSPQTKTDDGTVWQRHLFDPNTKDFMEGVYPKIVVNTLDTTGYSPAAKEAVELTTAAILVKEACAHLLWEIWTKLEVAEMKYYKQPTHIKAVNTARQIVDAEIISHTVTTMMNGRGRLVKTFDLASHLIAYQTMQGSVLARSGFMRDERITRVLEPTSELNLGGTPDTILIESFNWAIHDPEAQKLKHVQSDFNLIP